LAVSSRRGRADLFSCRQRSWDSPFGAFPSHEVPTAFAGGWTHLPFLSAVLPPPEGNGPAQLSRGFWALTLARVPGSETGISASYCWRLPWVSPAQGSLAAAWFEISLELLPRASESLEQAKRPRRLGVSISRRLARPTEAARATLSGFAPVRTRPFERRRFRAMCSPSVAASITAACQQALEPEVPRSTGVVRASS
jgi:hypothetical protein